MEGHTERMKSEKLYAHIHFDQTPDPDESTSNPNIISTDSLSDQAPLMELRGTTELTPLFRGITWSTSPDPLGDVGLSVRKIVAWPQGSRGNLGKYPGLKQVSLVGRKDTLDRKSFYVHYLNHVNIAREHHGMEKYAQNIDIEYLYGPQLESSAIDGISELWFADESDWFHRFYLHEDSQRVVREDTQNFIDFQTTSSIMVAETRFRRIEK
ncbi:MAG: EthD domain-containing protein [Actinomycetota bacterium]|nr:EthD domain-containing protein [Actinomycetota bacterium]MEC8974668.1 EthD domain-containing protein [Actinomycetota bacterium]